MDQLKNAVGIVVYILQFLQHFQEVVEYIPQFLNNGAGVMEYIPQLLEKKYLKLLFLITKQYIN